MKCLAQGHTALISWSWDSNSGIPMFSLRVPSTTHHTESNSKMTVRAPKGDVGVRVPHWEAVIL